MERDFFKPTRHSKWKDFNSHAHVERDGDTLEVWDDENISTHTLTWSVTP